MLSVECLSVLNVLSVEMLSVEMLNVMNVEGVECTHGSPSMLSIQTYQYMNNRSREYLYETVKWKERMRLERGCCRYACERSSWWCNSATCQCPLER